MHGPLEARALNLIWMREEGYIVRTMVYPSSSYMELLDLEITIPSFYCFHAASLSGGSPRSLLQRYYLASIQIWTERCIATPNNKHYLEA